MKNILFILIIILSGCGGGEIHQNTLDTVKGTCNKNDGILFYCYKNTLGVASIRSIYCKDGATFYQKSN